MLRKILNWARQKEREMRDAFGDNIDDPAERKRSWTHYLWFDHGVLRFWWKNFAQVAPGVYRSNHPHHTRFVRYADMGIKTVVNLRGPVKRAAYLFEVESCKALGMTLIDLRMGAGSVPERQTLLDLVDVFETTSKPFMMHCKSGADRTGLASAIYLIMYSDASDDEIRKQLSFTYIHIRKSKTGVLDYVLNVYLARRKVSPIGFREWVQTEYHKPTLKADYIAYKAKQRFWEGWLRLRD